MRISTLLPMVSLLCALFGCAAPPSSHSDGVSRDIVTPSDESESRRRARLRLELAVGYFEQGQTEVALDELKQVLVLDPAFPDAYNLRGLIFMRLNQMRAAEESFSRALSLSPQDANVLHNLGWLTCQQSRYPEAFRAFEQALANPTYGSRPKTLMALGVCQARAGFLPEAERSLSRSYELDAGNPVTGYNLASLLFRRREDARAQFYIRRLNNSELANAESLWLGVRIERRLGNQEASLQLGNQLKKRFPQSRESVAFEKGAFDE